MFSHTETKTGKRKCQIKDIKNDIFAYIASNWTMILIQLLKVKGSGIKEARVISFKVVWRKVVRINLEALMRELRECLEASYVSFFFIQKLLKLPVWGEHFNLT